MFSLLTSRFKRNEQLRDGELFRIGFTGDSVKKTRQVQYFEVRSDADVIEDNKAYLAEECFRHGAQ